MNSIIFLFSLLLILLFVTAMMSAAETAFFSLKPIDKDFLKKSNDKGYVIAKKLIDTPKDLLSIIAVFYFPPDRAIAGEFRDFPFFHGFRHDLIGAGRIDPDKTAFSRCKFPGPFEFALRVVARGEPDCGTLLIATFHAARVGAVGRHLGAIIKRHIS